MANFQDPAEELLTYILAGGYPWERDLDKVMKMGDRTKGEPALLRRIVNPAARQYTLERGSMADRWDKLFPKKTREEVAVALYEKGLGRKYGYSANASEEITGGLSNDYELLAQFIEMEAETSDLTLSAADISEIPDAVVDTAYEYDKALYDALEEVVRECPPKGGATAYDLWSAEAPYLVFMTLRGHGVGIWDGRWDHFYSVSEIQACVEPILERHLQRFVSVGGGGELWDALEDAAYELSGSEEYERNRFSTNPDKSWVRRHVAYPRVVEDKFIEFAMQQGDLTRDQARAAYERYMQERIIKIDPVAGGWSLTHGAFGDRDVLRRAAGLEDEYEPNTTFSAGDRVYRTAGDPEQRFEGTVASERTKMMPYHGIGEEIPHVLVNFDGGPQVYTASFLLRRAAGEYEPNISRAQMIAKDLVQSTEYRTVSYPSPSGNTLYSWLRHNLEKSGHKLSGPQNRKLAQYAEDLAEDLRTKYRTGSSFDDIAKEVDRVIFGGYSEDALRHIKRKGKTPKRASRKPAGAAAEQVQAEFDELVDYWRRSWGTAREGAAEQIMSALNTHPWLRERMAEDVAAVASGARPLARNPGAGEPGPVELRRAMNELLGAWKGAWHTPESKRYAEQIALLLRKYPWLQDQVPYDEQGLIFEEAKLVQNPGGTQSPFYRGQRVYVISKGGGLVGDEREWATVVSGRVREMRREGVGEPEPHILIQFDDDGRTYEPVRKVRADVPSPEAFGGYDVVWYWDGGTEVGEWRRADPLPTADAQVAAITRQGYIAVPGRLALGPPPGPPEPERFALLEAGYSRNPGTLPDWVAERERFQVSPTAKTLTNERGEFRVDPGDYGEFKVESGELKAVLARYPYSPFSLTESVLSQLEPLGGWDAKYEPPPWSRDAMNRNPSDLTDDPWSYIRHGAQGEEVRRLGPPGTPGGQWWARTAEPWELRRISADLAEQIMERPAQSSPQDYLAVYWVPPEYVKAGEAKWRAEKGWVKPMWLWERGRQPGGLGEMR